MLALVGFLVGVDPQMVEEVVPFSEDFAAILVLALQESNNSPGVRASIFKDHVIFSVWHMLLDSNLLEIELLTVPYNDQLFLLDLLVVLKVACEIKVEFGLDLFHGVEGVFDPHHLDRFAALLVLRVLTIQVFVAFFKVNRELNFKGVASLTLL